MGSWPASSSEAGRSANVLTLVCTGPAETSLRRLLGAAVRRTRRLARFLAFSGPLAAGTGGRRDGRRRDPNGFPVVFLAVVAIAPVVRAVRAALAVLAVFLCAVARAMPAALAAGASRAALAGLAARATFSWREREGSLAEREKMGVPRKKTEPAAIEGLKTPIHALSPVMSMPSALMSASHLAREPGYTCVIWARKSSKTSALIGDVRAPAA